MDANVYKATPITSFENYSKELVISSTYSPSVTNDVYANTLQTLAVNTNYLEPINTSGSILKSFQPGFTGVYGNYNFEMAADATDGNNPLDVMSTLVKDVVITKSIDALDLSLTVVNNYNANTVFVISAYDKDNNIIESNKSTVVNPTNSTVIKKSYSPEATQKIDHFGILRVVSDSPTIRLLSAYSWKSNEGKITVYGIVANSNVESQSVGFVATGYDVNNKAIETKTLSSYTSKGGSSSLSVILDAGSQISSVVVKAVGQAHEIELLSSADRLENGKVIVTGSVENGTETGQSVGIVATGYDANNKAIETKTISSYTSSGGSASFSVILDAGSQISSVVVKAAGQASEIVLLSAGDRIENGKVIATGSVENGTGTSQSIGIVATGFDANYKAIETKTISSYTSSGGSASFSVVLDAGPQITSVVVEVVGQASEIVLLSAADRLENGKVIATGSVENGTGTSQSIGIVATGYDVNNKAIETKTVSSYTSSGGSASFNVILDAGSQITSVVIKAVGQASDVVLLSRAYRMENGEIIATGSVENGTVTSQTIGIVATGYDVNNRAVETKSATSYTSSGGSGSFSVVLNAGSQISRVVFKTIGIATDLNLLSFAYRNINTTISATAVIENGTNSSTNVTATFTGFDSNDNPVEVKTANATISSKAVKEMSATFSLGSKITRVEVKTTPESSGNGVEVPDPSKFNQLDLSATSTYDLPGDVVSYYSFTAPTTSLYRFYTSYVGSSTMEEEPATRIQLFSDKNLQNQLASNDNSIGNIDGSLISKVDYTLTGGTTYYIKISPSALSSDFPYVRITVEQDADGSMDRAHILEDWELFSTSDFSSIFDIDYYKFELTEPTSVYYNIPNITIVLEDANGVELKKMVPGNKNSLFLQPGTYFLKSSTYLGYKDSDGDGLTDSQEQTGFRIISNGQVKVVKTNHLKSDSDQDGISDGTELLEGKFRTEDGYYQVIDDPSTVGFGSTEGTSFDLPSGYNWDTTDLLEIRTNILAAEEWKEKLKGYYNKVDEFSGSEVLGDVTKTELVYLSEEIGNAIINLNSVIEDMIMYIRDKGTNPDQVWLLMNTNSIEFLAYELKDPDRVGIASARASARMSISSESYDYVYWMKVGTLVHSAVKDRFTKDKGTPARFSNTVIPRTVRILRPDLVEDAARVDDDTPNSGGEAYLFELKTHNNTPANRAYYLKAQRQLNEYILYYQNAFKNKTVKKGTTGITTVDGLVEPPNWIPDGKVVPDTGTIPGTPFKAVLFHVLPDDGMVYYKLIKDTQDPKDVDPLIQKLKGNDRRQYEVEVEGEKVKATSVVKDKQSGKIAAIAYVGGALIIVILTNVDNTTGIGVADDPAAYATAGRLINAAIIAW